MIKLLNFNNLYNGINRILKMSQEKKKTIRF